MIEALISIILLPFAVAAAAFTLALGIGFIIGVIDYFKKLKK